MYSNETTQKVRDLHSFLGFTGSICHSHNIGGLYQDDGFREYALPSSQPRRERSFFISLTINGIDYESYSRFNEEKEEVEKVYETRDGKIYSEEKIKRELHKNLISILNETINKKGDS